MPAQVIIDGNNLLFAMHGYAPIPTVGRETMVRVVERWARRGRDEVVLVLDGARPRGPLAVQMASPRIDVRFSAPKSADDVIVDLLGEVRDPGRTRIVSSDNALRTEAHYRRCGCTSSRDFVDELFRADDSSAAGSHRDRPGASPQDAGRPILGSDNDLPSTDEWLDIFGVDSDDPDFKTDYDMFDE